MEFEQNQYSSSESGSDTDDLPYDASALKKSNALDLYPLKLSKKMEVFKEPSKPLRMLLIGPSGCGKTQMLKHLYIKLFKDYYDIVIVVSETISTGNYSYINTKFFLNSFDPELLLTIKKVQGKLIEEGKRMLKILYIFDDSDNDEFKDNQWLRKLFTQFRNYNVHVVFSVQDWTMLRPTLRQQLSHLVVFNQRCDDNIKRVLSKFGSGFVNQQDKDEAGFKKEEDMLVEVIKRNTIDFNTVWFCYYKSGADTRLKDAVFKYKAKLHKGYEQKLDEKEEALQRKVAESLIAYDPPESDDEDEGGKSGPA